MLVALIVLVPGCSTAQIDQVSPEMGGLPQGAPARPAQAPAFPAVHDMPPQRSNALLDAEQQKKLESDLTAIRDRQAGKPKKAAKAKDRTEKVERNETPAEKAARRKARKAATGQTARVPAGSGQAADRGASSAPANTPPWPTPTQNTGATARP